MKSYFTILTYLFIGLLCAWYIVVLYWAYNPNVSLEYRLYYIDKVLSDWPGEGGLKYEMGTRLFFGTEIDDAAPVKHRGQGWSGAEKEHSWTDAYRADLYFVIEKQLLTDKTDTDLIFIAYVHPFTAPDYGLYKQRVTVLVNDQAVDFWAIPRLDGFHEQKTVIPRELINSSLLKISFHFPDAASPKEFGLSDDSRTLGLAFKYMILEMSD